MERIDQSNRGRRGEKRHDGQLRIVENKNKRMEKPNLRTMIRKIALKKRKS